MVRNFFLGLLCGTLALRLCLWKFFPNADVFINDEVIFAAIICALGLLWALCKVIKRRAIAQSGLELPIFLLIAAAVSSLFHTVDLPSSLRSVLILGSELVFFYMFLDLLDTPTRVRWALVFLFGMTFVAAIYGIKNFFMLLRRPISLADAAFQYTDTGIDYLLAHRRAVSFFGWPNTLAGYLLLFLPLSLVLPFRLKPTWQKYAAAAVGLAVMACLFYTFSFLGWLSFILSVVVLSPFFWEKLEMKNWSKERKRVLLYGFFLFFILFLLVMLHKNFIMSLAPRLFYYKAAFTALLKNPLGGYGLDSFMVLCKPLTHIRGNLSTYVHNSYLQIWLETGIIGFLGIILLVVRVFRKFFVIPAKAGIRDDWVFIAIAWGLIAFLIDNLFNYTILIPNVALYWWVMLAVFCAMLKLKEGEKAEKGRNPMVAVCVLPIIAVMFVVLLRLSAGYMLYHKAVTSAKPGKYDRSLELLAQAEKWDPWSSYIPVGAGSIHLAEYGTTRLKNFLKLAAADYLEAVGRSPRVYYNYFVLGEIYDGLGDTTQGQVYTQKAMELSPSEFEIDNKMFHSSDIK